MTKQKHRLKRSLFMPVIKMLLCPFVSLVLLQALVRSFRVLHLSALFRGQWLHIRGLCDCLFQARQNSAAGRWCFCSFGGYSWSGREYWHLLYLRHAHNMACLCCVVFTGSLCLFGFSCNERHSVPQSSRNTASMQWLHLFASLTSSTWSKATLAFDT